MKKPKLCSHTHKVLLTIVWAQKELSDDCGLPVSPSYVLLVKEHSGSEDGSPGCHKLLLYTELSFSSMYIRTDYFNVPIYVKIIM